MMSSERPVIITGMHRSGTSLIAGFIHKSGIDLGDELVGPRQSNLYGHFEDTEILAFHSRVLVREFGHPMWAPGPPETTRDDREKAAELIAARQYKTHWGWKEPRTSLFLGFWNELLPDGRFVFVVRHPLLVLDSLSRRTGSRFYNVWKHNTFLKAWLTYNQECFQFYRRHTDRCLLVALRDVVEATDAFVRTLSAWLSVELDGEAFGELYDPGALTLSRSRLLLCSPQLRSESIALYEELRGSASASTPANSPSPSAYKG